MSRQSPPFPRRAGLALVDLVVVVVIIGVLVSLLVPMLMTAKDRSTRQRCMANLQEVGTALRHYADEHKGRLPSTRPGEGFDVRPDVSNAGADSPADTFGPDVPPNNVPAALFLLMRAQDLSPDTFVCPATRSVADDFGGASADYRSNFSDVSRNLSYGLQNPYADDRAVRAGFRWNLPALGRSFALLADRGPTPNFCDPAVAPDCALEDLHWANSTNHRRRGQNVLYADGRIEFLPTPFAGVNKDHIYRTRRGGVLDSPADANDSILLPAEE